MRIWQFFLVAVWAQLLQQCHAGEISLAAAYDGPWSVEPNYLPGYASSKAFSYKNRLYLLPDETTAFLPGRLKLMDYAHVLVDSKTFEWKLVELYGDAPPTRDSYCITQQDYKIFLYGGKYKNQTVCADSFILNMESFTWEKVGASSKLQPPPLYDHTCFSYKNRPHVYNGISSQSRRVYSMWSFIQETDSWIVTKYTTVYPNLLYGHVALHNDILYQYGGCDDLECYASLWGFNFVSSSWTKLLFEPNPDLGLPPSLGSGVSVVYNNKLFIYGAIRSPIFSSMEKSRLIVIDINSLMLIHIDDSSSVDEGQYGITKPQGRDKGALVPLEGRLVYVSKQLESSSQSSLWFLDPEIFQWTFSSLEYFPMDMEPAFLHLVEPYLYTYGGRLNRASNSFTDEIWRYSFKTHSWKCISPRSGSYYQQDIYYRAEQIIGFWNNKIFAIGGFDFVNSNPISVYFSLDEQTWAPFAISPDSEYSPSYQYGHLYLTVGNFLINCETLFNSFLTQAEFGTVFVTDLETMSWFSFVADGIFESFHIQSSIFTWNNKFSVYDPSKHVIYSLDLDGQTWEVSAVLSTKCIPNFRQQILHLDYLFFFGGAEAGTGINKLLLFDIDTGECYDLNHDADDIPNARMVSSLQRGNSWILYPGFLSALLSYNYLLPPIYKFELSFCRASTRIDGAKDAFIEDGSGSLHILPGSTCTWIVSNVNIFEVEFIDVSVNATLDISPSICPSRLFDIKDDESEPEKIRITNDHRGDFIHIPTYDSVVTLSVPAGDSNSIGFRLRLYKCSLGFLWDESCVCPENHFITFRNECLPCSDGEYQPRRNQYECLTVSEQSPVKQESVATLGIWPPSTVSGFSVIVDDTLFVFGGMRSVNPRIAEWNDMRKIYSTQDSDAKIWSVSQSGGEVSSNLKDGCSVVHRGMIVVLGGESVSGVVKTVYTLDPKRLTWSLHSNLPIPLSGHSCVTHDDQIYIHGGQMMDGSISANTFYFQNGVWKDITAISTPSIAKAGSVLYKSDWILFYGWTGIGESSIIWRYLFDSRRWEKFLFGSTCADVSFTTYARQDFQWAVIGAEIYVYGGLQDQMALSDILILKIEKQTIQRLTESFFSKTTSPLHVPSPKFAGVSVSFKDRLLFFGGAASTTACAGDDLWIFDPSLLTWRVGPNTIRPIFREKATIARVNDTSFVLFGGYTCRPQRLFLNDVWQFSTDGNRWTLLSDDSSLASYPRGRSSPCYYLFENKLHIFGGYSDFNVDQNVWRIGFEKYSGWEQVQLTRDLTPAQNILRRYDMAMAQDANRFWAWGGQISGFSIFSANTLVDFSTVYELKFKENQMIGIRTLSGPERLSSAHGFIFNDMFCVFGGVTLTGRVSSAMYCFNPETYSWYFHATQNYQSGLTNFAWVPMLDGAFIHGGTTGGGKTSSDFWYLDYESKAWTKLVNESASIAMQGHYGVSLTDSILLVGLDLSQDAGVVVMPKKPQFCTSSPTVHYGNGAISRLDDGSGVSKYFSNSSCSWMIRESTHIVVDFNLAPGDKLSITAVSLVGSGFITHDLTHNGQILLQSRGGFEMHMEAVGSALHSSGFDGFSAAHLVCMSPGTYDIRSGCICPAGFYHDSARGACNLCSDGISSASCGESRTDGSDKSEIALTIGVSVGLGVSLLLLSWIYYTYLYKRKHQLEQNIRKWHVAIDYTELEVYELLGAGGFGEVYRGNWRGTDVAIKKFYNQKMNDNAIQEFSGEIRTMVELRHPNIVLYMAACIAPPNLSIVCELMKKGSLYFYLHKEESISMKQKLGFVRDIVRGMNYLHSTKEPIIHQDLKSPNLLLDENLTLKISDFGLSAVKGEKKGEWNGSFAWLAPEVLLNTDCGLPSDVYSFAVILWEIMTQRYPYEDIQEKFGIVVYVAQQKKRMDIPESIPKPLQDLIRMCWAHEPQERPTFADILAQLESIIRDDFLDILDGSKLRKARLLGDETSVYAVSICVEDNTTLWDAFPTSMEKALFLFNEFIRKLCDKYDGQRMRFEADEHSLFFFAAKDAMMFALDAQELANLLDWPAELMSSDLLSEDGKGLFCGLRIKIGIVTGNIQRSKTSKDQSELLRLKIIDDSKALSTLAMGGQILSTFQVFEGVSSELSDVGDPYVREHTIRNADDAAAFGSKLFEFYPKSLRDRAEYISRNSANTTRSNSVFNRVDLQDAKVDSTGQGQNSSDGLTSSNLGEPPMPNSIPAKSRKLPPLKTSPRHHISESPSLVRLERHQPPRKKSHFAQKLSCHIDLADVLVQEDRIGVGTYGTVYLGTYQGQKVAVKKMHQQTGEEKYYLSFLNEVSIMQKLHHPNLVRLVGACTTVPDLAIITEYVGLGDLRSILSRGTLKWTDELRIKIAQGIACGMSHLHRMHPPIIHRDLKCSNILISDDLVPKVCDFGFARTKARNQVMTRCGTLAYEAPEILSGKSYSEKVDVYSFGIILWEIETGQIPYKDMDSSSIVEFVVCGNRLKVPSGQSVIKAAMTNCWHQDPSNRPSFELLTDMAEFFARNHAD